MRLTTIAVLGTLLGACSESATNVIDVGKAEGPKPSAKPSAETAAQDPAIEATNLASPSKVSACQIQDGDELRLSPVRAIGTEPFWSAQVEGRCVTYSTPEHQAGTRIWTRYNPGPDGGVWVGSLDGKPFKLITSLRQGCSDGMSDRSYPLDAILTVRGEERRGCAAPAGTGKP